MDNQFNKALRLLDFGKVDKAVEILKELLVKSKEEKNDLYFIRISCILGEIYFENEVFDVAKNYLTNVVSTKYSNDLVNYERTIAKELLQKIDI
ncbi:hypothetical protein KLA_15615 [Cellulophaga geojensis KL-A]|uniref:Tetratricopeptide repeat protein n=1 Tax=Cellulophaga geojensis KL-A TaxID=1328323 RepID=A0ABN0RK37_9FLAO|nr:hypothetical protein [Cellulophaga geojensis]EWH11438.1 hypothetical protein KLA_15615 [Cellulophaga geojensis KL-A]